MLLAPCWLSSERAKSKFVVRLPRMYARRIRTAEWSLWVLFIAFRKLLMCPERTICSAHKISSDTFERSREIFKISSLPLFKFLSKKTSHILFTIVREISGWELSTFARFLKAPVIYTKIIAFLLALIGILSNFSTTKDIIGMSLA